MRRWSLVVGSVVFLDLTKQRRNRDVRGLTSVVPEFGPGWSVPASWSHRSLHHWRSPRRPHEILKKLRRHNRLLVGWQPINEIFHHVESCLFGLQLESGDRQGVTLLLLFARSALAGHRLFVLLRLRLMLMLVEPMRLVSLAINLPVLGDTGS